MMLISAGFRLFPICACLLMDLRIYPSSPTITQRARVAALLFRQVQKDNDLSGLLFEKFDSHRNLMRYERRAFNQLRKKSLIKK
jgi:hypothetical protein